MDADRKLMGPHETPREDVALPISPRDNERVGWSPSLPLLRMDGWMDGWMDDAALFGTGSRRQSGDGGGDDDKIVINAAPPAPLLLLPLARFGG